MSDDLAEQRGDPEWKVIVQEGWAGLVESHRFVAQGNVVGLGEAAKPTSKTSATTSMVRLRGRCLRGERLIGYARHGQWKTITFVAGLRYRAMVAPFVFEGAINGPMFLAYVKQCLVPTLKRSDIVIMDNLPVHKDRRCRGGDRSGGRDAALSSAVLARPQSDRAGLQQSEGPCAQSGGTYDSAPLAKDRSHCHRFQRTRMQELLSARGLCPNVIGNPL